MKARIIKIIVVLSLCLPTVLLGSCTLDKYQNGGRIYCHKIGQEQYISSIFEFGFNIQEIVKRNGSSTFSIIILNSNFPEIKNWIYSPWQQVGEDSNYAPNVISVTIFNSSVRQVNFDAFDGFSALRTLDLGGNNISSFNFLTRIGALENLYLSNSKLNLDYYGFLYNYLLKKNNLFASFRHCNVSSVTLPYYNNDLKIDLSYNLMLHTVYSIYSDLYGDMLNIDGSYYIANIRIKVKDLKMSDFKGYFNYSLLTNISVINSLALRNNNIYKLNNSDFKNLKDIVSIGPGRTIDLTNTKLSNIDGAYFQNYVLKLLILSANNLTKLTNYTFRDSNIETLDISKSKIVYIDSTVFSGLQVNTLNLSQNKLKTLKNVFNNIKSVETIDLAFNPIKFIDKHTFANCTFLRVLNLTNCYVRHGGFGTNSFLNIDTLRHLEISFVGTLTGKNIRNQFLKMLIIRNSNLTELQNDTFKGFSNLRELHLPGTSIQNISSLALRGLCNIEIIDLNNLFLNASYKPVFQNISSLPHLDLSSKNIAEITSNDFQGLTRLQTLNLSFNSISNIEVKAFFDLKNLNVLSLSSNKLSQLPIGLFSTLSNLTHLYLNNNTITFLNGLLSRLDNLSYLDISFNQVTTLIFAPYSLKCLVLSHNNIDFNSMTRNFNTEYFSLQWIDINGNTGSCLYLKLLLSFFKKTGISYKPLNPIYYSKNIEGISCSP